MTVCFVRYIGAGAASLLTSAKSISNFPIQRLQKPLGKQTVIDMVRFGLDGESRLQRHWHQILGGQTSVCLISS